MPSPPILISARPQTPTDVQSLVHAAGFSTVEHALGAVPAVDFAPLGGAIVCPADAIDAAAAQTRRWRVELSDRVVPVVWVLDSADAVRVGLEAGADVCLVRPLDEATFAPQLHALLRVRDAAERTWARADETVVLARRLQGCYDREAGERKLAQTLHRSLTPDRLPEVGPYRFVARPPGDSHFLDAWTAGDDLEFVVAHVTGFGVVGGLLGLVLRQTLAAACVRGSAGRLPLEEVLRRTTAAVAALGLPDSLGYGVTLGRVEVATGRLELAGSNMPGPRYVPAAAEPGGVDLPPNLRPGDRLLFFQDVTPLLVLERAAAP